MPNPTPGVGPTKDRYDTKTARGADLLLGIPTVPNGDQLTFDRKETKIARGLDLLLGLPNTVLRSWA
jgi:hypothetical protein